MAQELQRGGQIYFLHNEVESIQKMAATLTELVPEARIRIAHGQMAEKDLEQVMLDFWERRADVLVCTTIVENGLDIPNTTCEGGPCKIGDWAENTGGLTNLVCSCM